MSSLQVTNLVKSYDGNKVLKGLNLEIKPGEVYGFIGMNGAGKTTTIHLIMSLIHKDSGDIKVLGKDVSFTNQQYKNHIGFVPDVPQFPKHMNPYEYLVYTLEMYKMTINKQHINDLLDFVGLGGVKKRIHTFSRGMKQRLAIAQALVHDPEIIIMDEPTSALDPKGRKDVMNIIEALKGKKTVFYSTHILDDVERVCDRIGILHDGNLILEDTIENLKERFTSNTYLVTVKQEANELPLKSSLIESIDKENKAFSIIVKDGVRANQLLAELSTMDVDITSFEQKVKSIEDIFMEETT